MTKIRYKTGQRCPATGIYVFDGYVRFRQHTPTAEEQRIPLDRGDTFPPIRSRPPAAAWWVRA